MTIPQNQQVICYMTENGTPYNCVAKEHLQVGNFIVLLASILGCMAVIGIGVATGMQVKK